jgi:protein-S-isoprenylcysteine O-methyltransferase Ste14
MNIFTLFLVLFTVSEVGLVLAKRSKTGGVKSRADRGSMLLLWLAIPTSLTATGFIAGYRLSMFPDLMTIEKVAEVVIVVGFIIRWTAIMQLGKMFTVDVAISNAHTLKTTGLYRIVRHPSYLGLLLIIEGLVLFKGSALAFIISTVLVFLAMNYRMVVEENALKSEFGSDYENYMKRVKRILPFIY